MRKNEIYELIESLTQTGDTFRSRAQTPTSAQMLTEAPQSISPLQAKLSRGAVIGVFKGHLAVMTPVPNSAKGVNLEQLLTGQASVTARNNMRTVCAWLNARLAKVIPNFDPYSELALQPDVMCDVLPADATSAAKSTDGLMLAWTTDRSMQSARQRKVEQMIIQQYKLPTLA